MAKPTRGRIWKGDGPPDPRDSASFENWLTDQPREWSVTIATRVALRVLPLVQGVLDPAGIILPVFRATAIARKIAKYPRRVIVDYAAAARAAALAASRAAAATNVASTVEVVLAAAAAARAAAFAAADARVAAYAAADGHGAVADAAAAAGAAAAAVDAAITAANAVTDGAAIDAVIATVTYDVQRLYDGVVTAEQLARGLLWPTPAPAEFSEAWHRLRLELTTLGSHWSAWIDWYENVALHEPHRGIKESEDAAYTDIPGKLPWGEGAEAVNREVLRRLRALHERRTFQNEKTTLAQLAEVASPQPFITGKGQLDAGPNQPFDVPAVDDDLSTLPIRQRNLIKTVLGDLPKNAPKHLKSALRSYDEELKVRGAQPILGLLKDDADIIAAAVAAPSTQDEWLEPGMRKAFDRFAENHSLFVEHFPLDAEREAVYAQTPLDEERATGKELTEPFEIVAKAAQEAHKAGATTDDFLAVIDRMTEFARVLSTQPPTPPLNKQSPAPDAEIKISPEDRIQPVTTKKRVILGALGFFERTYALIGTTVTVATASYAGMAEALKPAIEMLSRLLR
jgi:hypothetical protein